MKPVLSLVLPVFNVAPYLHQCLGSLCGQGLDDTEIILVDDGSTDQSWQILSAYRDRHPGRIRLIRQENVGISGARHRGLSVAQGEFVAFPDPDDFITSDYYRRLAVLARQHHLDMAHGNAMYHFEGRRPDYPIFHDAMPTRVMTGREVLRRRLRDRVLLHMVWMHVYRRSFVERERLNFPAGLAHQDVPWTTAAFMAAKRVAYDPFPGYFYRQRLRPMSAVQKDQRNDLVIRSACHNARALAAMLPELEGDGELQRLLRWQMVDGALSVFHKLKQVHSGALKRRIHHKLWDQRFFNLLWAHAVDFAQRRRLARNVMASSFYASSDTVAQWLSTLADFV